MDNLPGSSQDRQSCLPLEEILEQLGEGGMGVVNRAEDLTQTCAVALKFLPQALEADEAERTRCFQEARAAAILKDPQHLHYPRDRRR
jgi:serine/threonine protein kinase